MSERVRVWLTRVQAEWIAADASYHAEQPTTVPRSRARWRAIARAARVALGQLPRPGNTPAPPRKPPAR